MSSLILLELNKAGELMVFSFACVLPVNKNNHRHVSVVLKVYNKTKGKKNN